MMEVRKLLKANFASFVLSYRITNENLESKISHDWHGQISDVIGMNEIARVRLLTLTNIRNE